MRPPRKTSFLLDGRAGWRAALRNRVSVGATSGIRLAASADPHGPVGLLSPDGSLGRIVMPRSVAIDRRCLVYLLVAQQAEVLRFDPWTKRFRPLPLVGGEGPDPRQFHDAANIAIAGDDLYVADSGNRRVQVFALRTLALRHIFGSWETIDVASRRNEAYILAGGSGTVFRHRAGTDRLDTVIAEPTAAGRWSRVAVDNTGSIYLLDAAVPRLEIYNAHGRRLGEVIESGDVRDRFEAPAVTEDHKARLRLPGGLTFDRSGAPATVQPDEPAGLPAYAREGSWVSQPLDSLKPECSWHRIEIEIPELPPGMRVAISTFTSEELRDPREIVDWKAGYTAIGPMQAQTRVPAAREFLVQSDPGRYLLLRLQLSGDGFGTPAVTSVRIHYPRETYLDYLPAIYQSDEESRRFLERFLSLFQTEWDGLEDRIAEMARYFDPKSVPEGGFLEFLAAWLALPLEGSWDGARKRRLLMAAPEIWPKLGTVEGVREYLRIYLENIAGVRDGFPQIVEGFRERERLLLAAGGTAALGSGAPLWSLSAVGRLQLAVYARTGEARLVSTGDPERDVFHEFAHRFRVFVPSGWIRTRDEERMLRGAIDAVKPAHTAYDLCLVEPRFRVAVQSTVGVDTVIGRLPAARLACVHGSDEPDSRPPRNLLGYDTVLACRPHAAGFGFMPGLRAGVDTALA